MILVLTGDNFYLQQKAIQDILAGLPSGTEIVRLNADKASADELTQLLTGNSLFAASSAVVLRQFSDNPELWAQFVGLVPEVAETTAVIALEPALDKRTKAYKTLKDHAEIREFKQLEGGELVNWLQAEARALGANLAPEAAKFMVDYIGPDQSQLASELDKLTLVTNSIGVQDIERYSEQALDTSAFDVIDLIVSGQQAKLSRKLDILSVSEDAYRFFGLLAAQASNLLAIKAGGQRPVSQIARDFGANPYAIQALSRLAAKVNQAKLKATLKILADCDRQMKSSGIEAWRLVKQAALKASAV